MTHLRVSPLDLGIVLGYFVFTIALGAWFSRRKVETGEGFFLAGRSARWPVIGASLFSANISSQQFVGMAGLAYTLGLVAGAFQLVGAGCFLLLALFFVDVYLGLKLTTAPEFFERRYGSGTRLFVAGINVVMILAANLTAALYAGATVLTTLLGWTAPGQFLIAVVAIAGGAAICAIFGGLRSVMWIDVFQASVLVLGGLVTLFAALAHAGGLAALLPMHDPAGHSMWSVVQPWNHAFGWLPLLTGAVILGVHGHCTDHDYVQRALAARSVYHSKMGAVFAALLKILALFIIAAPGVIAARLIPGLAHPDQAYAEMVAHFVPPGLVGLVLAGLLAAILGTMAAGLAASSSMLTYDFALKIFPRLDERARVRLGRALMALILVGCSAAAPLIARYSGLFAYLVKLWSLLAPPVFVCVVFGIFSRRADNRGAIATLIVGSTLGLAAFLVLDSPAAVAKLPVYLRNPLNIGFTITLVCTAVMLAASRGRFSPAARLAFAQRAAVPMSDREQRRYRLFLASVLIVLVAVIVLFSPLGLLRA
ncbi:sodium/solute symporter [Horticoccus luteus]|uniref:Sodium/solute symporter n=1 Tax=Horticoccus luteus TaxID=2862869 RepID=A0A8F9XG00_9BACT|nr:sodium/solute symporter [Horticoccus luteus]QYM78622.1 sodium/solute symporter [Horticoccus luteus]